MHVFLACWKYSSDTLFPCKGSLNATFYTEMLTPLSCVVFNQSLVFLCNLSSYCTGKLYSNRGAMDSSAHGEHSWAPSFDHGIDNDSLWNFGPKVGFCSCFLTFYHVVDILQYVVLTSAICFSGRWEWWFRSLLWATRSSTDKDWRFLIW